MASPMHFAPNGGWNPNGQAMPPNNQECEDSGLQVRPMGLKVHYTFDKDGKDNCLARYPHTLQVQAIPIDERTSIGVLDLRVCLQAVTECSPELAGQDGDYTIYALDYSEPDTPLVGQGMLSWALDSMRGDWAHHPPKMVTGRVTQNLLAVFGGGNRETLEVRLKLTVAAKVQRREYQPTMDMQAMRPMETAITPAGAAEWNSFMQSNPQIGHSAHVSRVASPALSQGPPPPMKRRDSFGPAVHAMPTTQEIPRVAPVPVDPATIPPQPSSRPSSRSSRRKQPTGRPRGRPRKKPVEGNTSGYEDGTEGEEGPTKKKAKTTKTTKVEKVDKVAPNPFAAGPESLRVAASTSGSIRNFRPIAVNNDNATAGHLQEVPRAPTPVPEGGPMNIPPRGGPNGKPRRESSMRQESTPNFVSQYPQPVKRPLSPSQEDGRSPESLAPTPNYSEGSPQEIGSSPPLPRAVPFTQSSPPPSSPMLPPMPQQGDSNFTNVDIDDLFEEAVLQPLQEGDMAGKPSVHRVVEVTDSSGIPTQVFQIQDGPDGHGLVHIQNFNTPYPTSTLTGLPLVEAPPSLPPLKKNVVRPRPQNPASKRSRRPSPPALAPTPPPTTDAVDKTVSPAPPPAVAESEPALPAVDDKHTTLTEPGRTPEATLTEPSPAPEAILAEPPSAPEAVSTTQSSVPAQASRTKPLNPPRHLSRSQSAGPLMLPTVSASESAGPSSLSQSTVADASRATTETPAILHRSNSTGPLSLPIPASDPFGPPGPLHDLAIAAYSEAPCPPSDALPTPSSPPRFNKNQVKKQSIKQRLEAAIANGEMPPFCTNCGAIETPTWRKIWVQDHDGIPEYVEYSEKPGRITAIDILKRDEENRPLSYRLIKKSLCNDDDKTAWLEQLLCNPCGIWVSKYRSHRPQNKWDNSFGRLGQDRRKRIPGQSTSRSRKSRTKSDSQPNLFSDTYFATDPLGPIEPSSPRQPEAAPSQTGPGATFNGTQDNEPPTMPTVDGLQPDMGHSIPGSTHSRGSGTVHSPIDLDMDGQLGSTRRLLFPSPLKDSTPRVLREVNANIISTTECRQNKELAVEKENMAVNGHEEASKEHDDLEALFQSPSAHARPSTPPPKVEAMIHSTPFKTPTRPTPSHRPITRSVSRSLRSVRDVLMSPSQLQRTPTKTPRGSLNLHGSASRRRSPRNHQVNFDNVFDSPLSRTISQMLSEPGFDMSNEDLDLSSLPTLETGHGTLIDFGNLLSTDAVMPTSSPKDGLLGFDYNGSADIWAQWGIEQKVRVDEMEE
ncbi:hypothetical protein AK830_g12210 [Neonectria ditissima]|uniref:Ams2/SPT21 N-terminal domain-containing protein n=1 Tax=Neonectria ditissima TaxID=78410 RepID=A0A0N8H4U6_9HYPO|nr:hypothetical protein AK830_g12210 [Neonectria ditissima]